MEAQKPKIALYVQRSFGEKLTATFDFIKENWKPLMKFTTYPVSYTHLDVYKRQGLKILYWIRDFCFIACPPGIFRAAR